MNRCESRTPRSSIPSSQSYQSAIFVKIKLEVRCHSVTSENNSLTHTLVHTYAQPSAYATGGQKECMGRNPTTSPNLWVEVVALTFANQLLMHYKAPIN